MSRKLKLCSRLRLRLLTASNNKCLFGGRGVILPAIANMKKILSSFLAFSLVFSCTPTVEEYKEINATVDYIEVCGQKINPGKRAVDVLLDCPDITVFFSDVVNLSRLDEDMVRINGYVGKLSFAAGPTPESVIIKPSVAFNPCYRYILTLEKGSNLGLNLFDKYTFNLITEYDKSDKFERIPDEDLLTLVQKQTFKFFWDYAHPVSGLARERLGSGNTVTTSGSGFGIGAIPVAVERGFVTREEASARMRTIIDFLSTKADRFHGAFPHWLDGETGKVIPFSQKDNGADLVETAFLIQGLLTARAYFNRASEADIRSGIDALWHAVEWDWFTRGGEKALYWHWSPNYGWDMNMRISGWNEGLIVYVLAASSPTHTVSADVYREGWARGGSMTPSVNGPLFFAHYSFLGLDPRGLGDAYCDDYFEHNTAHARYNYDHCVRNPGRHAGYSASSWGLTASDIPGGYTASSPSNDKGVIAPTAALASFPYVPDESMAALHTFYYIYGDKLWGEYGFKDAFSLDAAWFASSYIAIDQGPIVVMIENYRSGLCWELFMSNQEVLSGLAKLGFSVK